MPPSLHRACNNQPQDHRPSFLSGEAWQVALGCRYGSQRTPWWGGCRQDDLASNLRSKGKKIALSPIFYKSHFLILVVGSRKVSMGFLRERDFSRDQPCETRLLARLESRMVSWEKFAEVVGTRRVSGERHVLYLTSYVRTEQVWSRMSRETGLARRDHGLTVSSCVSSRKLRVSKNGTRPLI